MNVMKPIASDDIPSGESWVYEVKYDGFRAVLYWEENNISIVSRNGKDLTNNFPEIVSYCLQKEHLIRSFLPLQLDGELVILNTQFQSNFPLLQQRGRFKSWDKIKAAADQRPAHFLVFDMLLRHGKSTEADTLKSRKDMLFEIFSALGMASIKWSERLGWVRFSKKADVLWEQIKANKGEGLVAKRLNSRYIDGKAHSDWFKVKNWRTIHAIITGYDITNGYFVLSVYNDESLVPIGKFKHGLDGDELNTFKRFVSIQGKQQGGQISLPPGVCAAINCLDVKDGELREPEFKQFRLDLDATLCTAENLQWDLAMFPKNNDISKRDKMFYQEEECTKEDVLIYLRNITPYMLPFLNNKALTIIRCPDGIHGESFFQKHYPDYAPSYVAGKKKDDNTLLRCDTVEALVWFGNHGALEYHVPFQLMDEHNPTEIAFDLDPPSIDAFELAIYASRLLKQLLDKLELKSYVKTSGNKGLQVYIPIPENSLSYDDTASFTYGIAKLLVEQYPDYFTIERFKKNRGNRLYIDYVQHGKNKTLIAPYSPRIHTKATVSTPLFWSEIQSGLQPTQFTIDNVVERVMKNGCPFADYFEAKDNQSLQLLRDFVAEQDTR